MSLFDRIRGQHFARAREGLSRMRGRLPSGAEIKDEVFELGEVAAFSAGVAAAEGYWGEEATTVGMKDDPSGATDENGKAIKVSGTGVPVSGILAAVGIVVANVGIVSSPGARKHVINATAGFASAFGYRKAFGWAQKKRDDADKAAGKTPTYAANQFGGAIAGEKFRELPPAPSTKVAEILQMARREVQEARAANGR